MSPTTTATSKFLSLILRHQPEVVGVSLDGNGWVEVDVLLAAMRKHGHALDRPTLDEIVATNNKKRFEFSDDGTRIRACQGHSLKDVDLQLEAKEPPEHLYHGTATSSMVAIRASGLQPQSRQYVHLSLDIGTAVKVGKRHGMPVVLIVEALKMHKDGHVFYLSHNNVWLTKTVPTQYFYTLNADSSDLLAKMVNLAQQANQKPLDVRGIPLDSSQGKIDTH